MKDDEPVFVPRPGSVYWRLLTFLTANPKVGLTRLDISQKFECAMSGVDTLLKRGIANGCLVRARNAEFQWEWSLGDPTTFRLEPMPENQHIPDEQPEAVVGKGMPIGAKWSAIYPGKQVHGPVVESPAPAATEAYRGRLRAPPNRPVQAPKIVAMCPFKETVILATETGAFMYDSAEKQFRPIAFAAQ